MRDLQNKEQSDIIKRMRRLQEDDPEARFQQQEVKVGYSPAYHSGSSSLEMEIIDHFSDKFGLQSQRQIGQIIESGDQSKRGKAAELPLQESKLLKQKMRKRDYPEQLGMLNDSDEAARPLIEPSEREQPQKQKRSCKEKCIKCCLRKKKLSSRVVFLNGNTVYKGKFPNNKIVNTKYNIITFVPLVLFNQFKFFFNLFFLIIACTQFIEILRVGFLFTFLAPLAFVLTITMIKEAWDDVQRYKRDKEINMKKYKQDMKQARILRREGVVEVECQKIKVGDIIQLNQNSRIPADCILLRTSEKQGTVFIRTDQLDGETDWKPRDAIRFVQNQPLRQDADILNWNSSIDVEPPSKEIYKFEGTFQFGDVEDRRQSVVGQPGARFTQFREEVDDDSSGNGHQAQPELMRRISVGQRVRAQGLGLNNTLWANTVLASKTTILALVIYTGKHTRAEMNSKMPRSKTGLVDNEINTLSKILFVLMTIISLIIVALNNFTGAWYIELFRFILLLSSIIPISLRVNLDMAKIWYCWLIGQDKEIPGTIARNSTIPEELGRIEAILTDKTGTLTQNDMTLKLIENEFGTYAAGQHQEMLTGFLEEECEKSNAPLRIQEMQQEPGRKRIRHADKEKPMCRDLITALVVCHNVTPVYDDETGQKALQASSPDEVALVKFAESLKMDLVDRENNKIIIKNAAGNLETYRILADFPFSSETKRMGILLQHEDSEKIIFYSKGAESVMENLIKPTYKAAMIGACDRFSLDGLRTLVIAQKPLSFDFYSAWSVRYQNATASRHNREIAVAQVRKELEEDLDMVGVTGVEDKLQVGVFECVEKMREAGIKVWMLTGDKVETATCIAISAGLKGVNHGMYEMRETRDSEIERSLQSFKLISTNTLLIVDGKTITRALEVHRELFFQSAIQAPAVVCCRCSPTQKSEVVKSIKSFTKKRTCSIGDGGNDVAMIQEADVGIGIVGKEGKQASLAADFSINQFSYIKQLILWHGRLSYTRTSVLSQFVIHRGLIISVIQAVFSIIFYFAAIPIYNGMLMLGYTTVYTSLPVFSLVFDEDANISSVMQYPLLYRDLQKGRRLSFKTFLIWVSMSIYQGSMVIILTILIFSESYITNIVTITFSALIIIELLNILTTVKKLQWKILASILLSLVIYLFSILVLKDYINTSVITWIFLLKIIAITAATWLPPYIISKLFTCCFPDNLQNLNK